ncbi:hypothetical protein IPZ61_04355 [Streptomyces sioyaensis]|uniref:hypothetical protein n=1 Tax=Streptomyces sioyaensis TaxID=67364 RepID=UPI001F2152B5|nr:hypothetical protein [Streptomyces sioyaensis]MCF3172548.1 hypothetical protein [Streptomyces sioyaensis]
MQNSRSAADRCGSIADITADGCVEFATNMRGSHRARHVTLFYTLPFEMGILGEDAPPTLAAARAPGQRSVQQVVGSYRIVSPRVRELLIAYLTIRKPELDYTSLQGLAVTLCLTYCSDLEKHHPGIDSTDLAPDVAAAWKHRVKTSARASSGGASDGRNPRGSCPRSGPATGRQC